VRGGNERNKAAAPWCVWGGDIDADHGALLNRDGGNAGQLGDQIAKVGLVPNQKEGVVTASSEELGDMRRSWTVGKLIIDCCSRL
jgi:hypothetical protein